MSRLRKILFLSALLATIVALTTSLLATTGCSFVKAQAEVNEYGFGPIVGIGLYSFEVGGQCYNYPDDTTRTDFGWKFRLVQVLSIVIAVLGGLVLLVLLVSSQFQVPETAMQGVGWALLVCALLQGLTLLAVFLSDACTSDALDLFGEGYVNLSVVCMQSRGSRLAIAATAFWAVGSILTMCMPRLGANGESYTLIN